MQTRNSSAYDGNACCLSDHASLAKPTSTAAQHAKTMIGLIIDVSQSANHALADIDGEQAPNCTCYNEGALTSCLHRQMLLLPCKGVPSSKSDVVDTVTKYGQSPSLLRQRLTTAARALPLCARRLRSKVLT